MSKLLEYKKIKFYIPLLLSVLISGILCFDCYGREDGYITMKITVKNQSPFNKQIVPFKQYLPREITADDVIDSGDLEVEYDSVKDKYFVHNDFNMEPNESKIINVTMRDVWIYSKDEIEAIKRNYNDSLKNMKDTLSTDKINSFKEYFDSKIGEIEQKIKRKSFSFNIEVDKKREIKRMISALNVDISKLKNMKKEIDSAPPKTERAWNIMISIVVSMIVVSFSFFYLFFAKFNPYESMYPKRKVPRIDDIANSYQKEEKE